MTEDKALKIYLWCAIAVIVFFSALVFAPDILSAFAQEPEIEVIQGDENDTLSRMLSLEIEKSKNFSGSDDEIKNFVYLNGKLDYLIERLNRIEDKKCEK